MRKSTFTAVPDPGDPGRRRGRPSGGGGLPQARYQHADVLRVEEQVRGHVDQRAQAHQGAGGRERAAQAHVRRGGAGERGDQGCAVAKIVTPSATRDASRAHDPRAAEAHAFPASVRQHPPGCHGIIVREARPVRSEWPMLQA